MRILFIDNDGAGFAGYIDIAENTNVEQFFAIKMQGRQANDYMIRVNRQPVSRDYVLQEGVTPKRYQYIMHLKVSGKLIDRVAKCPDGNFRRNWKVICKHASIDDATFHDLRSTCITEWFEQGMMPHEVQRLAGHSSIETTMKYYVGIRESMIGRAREASSAALGGNSIATGPKPRKERQHRCCRCPTSPYICWGCNNRGDRT